MDDEAGGTNTSSQCAMCKREIETSSCPLCTNCLVTQVKNVKHGVQQFKGALEKSDSQLRSVEHRLTKELEKAGSCVRAISDESSALQDAARKMFDGLKRVVTKSSREFATVLREKTKERKQKIDTEKRDVEGTLEETRKYRKQCQELITNNSLDVLDYLDNDGSKIRTGVDRVLEQSADRSISTVHGLEWRLDCSPLLSDMVNIIQSAKKVVDLESVKKFKDLSNSSTHRGVDDLSASLDEDQMMNSSADASLDGTEPLTEADHEPEALGSFGQELGVDSSLSSVSGDASSPANGGKLLSASESVLCDSTSEKRDKTPEQKSPVHSESKSLCLSLTPASASQSGNGMTHQQSHTQTGKSASLSLNNICPRTPETSASVSNVQRKYVFKELSYPFTSDTLALGGSQMKPTSAFLSSATKVRPDNCGTGHRGDSMGGNGRMILMPVRSTHPSATFIKAPATSQASVTKSPSLAAEVSSADSDEEETPPESHYDNCGFCSHVHYDKEVVRCASCPLVFHWRCVDLTTMPEIGWKCKVCGMEQPESNSISLCDGDDDPYVPILKILLDHPNSVAMKESDPRRHHKDRAVKKPTDLTAIDQKLQLGKYNSDRRQFIVDVRHVFVNCSRTHKPWTIEAAMGRRMSMLFEQLLAQCPTDRSDSDSKRSRRE